jgi:hypothetical protein
MAWFAYLALFCSLITVSGASDFDDLNFNPDKYLGTKVSLRGKLHDGPLHDTKTDGKFYRMALGSNQRYQDGSWTKTRFEPDGNYALVYVPVGRVDSFVSRYKKNPGFFSGIYRKLERNEYDRYDGVMQKFVYFIDMGTEFN